MLLSYLLTKRGSKAATKTRKRVAKMDDRDFAILEDYTWQELVTEVYRRGITVVTVDQHYAKLIKEGDQKYADREEDDA